MNAFAQWLAEIGGILAESGPYLLVGFVIAGLIQVLLPPSWVFRQLGTNDWRSVTKAALVGAPVPLCSCSVIPTAVALRRSGASRGATTSFLVATPETGVDSIGISWALLDPFLTITRPLAAIVTAIAAGLTVQRFGGAETDGGPDEADDEEHAHDHEDEEVESAQGGPLRRALAYAFGPLMADLTPWFVLGFAVSALIVLLVPDGFFGGTVPNGWPAMFAMLVVGIPLYVCATASTPVAAALIVKGLDPGAALVFLLAGPATNVATIGIVSGFLGRRAAGFYVASIAVVSLLLGALTNALYPLLGLDPSAIAGVATEGFGPIAWISGAVLGVALLVHAIRARLDLRFARAVADGAEKLGLGRPERAVRIAAALALLVGWASTSVSVVEPGQSGFRMRFGAAVGRLDGPGAVWHAPWPLERVELVRVDAVRATSFGASEDDALAGGFASLALRPDPRARDLEAEAEVSTADEALLRVAYAVHWAAGDAHEFRFGLEEPEALVRALAESSLRRVAALRRSDEMLVADRAALEAEFLDRLEAGLAELSAGLRAIEVHVLELHAPREVHDAFRDVASALEDRAREKRRAERHRNDRVAAARGRAARTVEEARAAAVEMLAGARGAATAFDALADGLAADPALGRERLRQDAARRALEAARLVLVLGKGIDVEWIEDDFPPARRAGGREEDR